MLPPLPNTAESIYVAHSNTPTAAPVSLSPSFAPTNNLHPYPVFFMFALKQSETQTFSNSGRTSPRESKCEAGIFARKGRRRSETVNKGHEQSLKKFNFRKETRNKRSFGQKGWKHTNKQINAKITNCCTQLQTLNTSSLA